MNNLRNKKNEGITYKDVLKRLKKADIKDYLDDFKKILEFAGVFLGNPEGDAVQAVISALAEKSIIIDIGNRALEKVKSLAEPSYLDKTEKMQLTYDLICYTAFFDTLNSTMPEIIRERIKLLDGERKRTFNAATKRFDGAKNEEYGVVFPNMPFGLRKVDESLIKLYDAMTDGVKSFVRGLAFADDPTDKEMAFFNKFIEKLPEAALNTFHDQYLALCADFNEFYIYLSMERDRDYELKLDDLHDDIITTAMRCQAATDAGLSDLKKAIKDLPHQIKTEDVMQIATRMRLYYQKLVTEPIIDSNIEDDIVKFPPIEKAFIPQAYKLLRYSKNMILGSDDTWTSLEPQQDMTAFWASYISDINSISSILLILGEPGGGKSLLSKVVAARLSSESSVVVRIPLRDHSVGEGIDSIVCKQFEDDGDSRETNKKFSWYSEEFSDDAITLIFDGYDEVQQATGNVYRSFLIDLIKFQNTCKEMGRPVRIVVTSRETLIDKAEIPAGTTVMKLLEFDEGRKKAFATVWNEENHGALQRYSMKDFALPSGNTEIDELSSQPLLLTMLAIYDADFENGRNALMNDEEKGAKLDRTTLYDRLLRRFIRRELRKGPRKADGIAYNELSKSDQEKRVDFEMKKLGVAALGMFVREKLSIRIDELEADFIKSEIIKPSPGNGDSFSLRDTEAFLGSFFFIHDPRSKKTEENSKAVLYDEQNASFEFLHKTFYEFLLADITLETVMDAIDYLYGAKSSKRSQERYNKSLNDIEGLNLLYFLTLGGGCLCTEPEILKMISEWKESIIEKYFNISEYSNRDSFIGEILGDVFDNHVDFIINGSFKELAVIDSKSLLSERPYPQSCAVYLLNMLSVRLLIDRECTINVEKWSCISQYIKLNLPKSQKDEQGINGRPKLNFDIDPNEETLLGFMTHFTLRRVKDEVVLSVRDKALELEQKDLLEARMEVFDFMQDDISSKLYALHYVGLDDDTKRKYRSYLHYKGMNLWLETEVDELGFQLESIERISPFNRKELHDSSIKLLKESRDILAAMGVNNEFFQYTVMSYLDNLLNIIQERFPVFTDRELEYAFLNYWIEIVMSNSLNNSYTVIRKATDITKKLFIYTLNAERVFYGERLDSNYHVILFDYLEFVSHRYPNLALELCVILINRQGLPEKREWIERAFRTIEGYGLDSFIEHPHSAATLLKVLHYINKNDIIYDLYQSIYDHLAFYLAEESYNLPELFKIVIKIGHIDWVKLFLNYVGDNVYMSRLTIRKNESTLTELLNIAEMTGATHFEYCVLDIYRKMTKYREYRGNNGATIRKMAQFALSGQREGKDMLGDRFFSDYPICFEDDPKETVELLLRIIDSSSDRSMFNPEWFEAYDYSLSNFQFLLNKSLKVAVDLLMPFEKNRQIDNDFLISFGKIYVGGFTEYTTCVQACFNYVLAERDRSNSRYLFRLVDRLVKYNWLEISDYFKNNIKYISNLNFVLAERISEKFNIK